MSPAQLPLRLALLLPLLLSSVACSHTVTVRSDPPGARIHVDGRDLGPAPVRFEESPGSAAHRLRAELPDRPVVELELPRDQLDWLPVAGLGLASATLAGGLCLTAGLLANPVAWSGLCGGCLICSTNADLGCTTMCAGLNLLMLAPTSWTAPAMSLGTLLGLSPLGGLWWLATSPDQVTLTLPAAAGSPSTQASPGPAAPPSGPAGRDLAY